MLQTGATSLPTDMDVDTIAPAPMAFTGVTVTEVAIARIAEGLPVMAQVTLSSTRPGGSGKVLRHAVSLEPPVQLSKLFTPVELTT